MITKYKVQSTKCSAFTLIELLVVISIVGILVGLSLFGLRGSREAARDAKRKADLETIRGGLEIYRADCGIYPPAITFGSALVGSGSPAACAAANIYISLVPKDPLEPAKVYLYARPTTMTYELCAALEQGGGAVSCGGSTNCGGGAGTCNYKIINP